MESFFVPGATRDEILISCHACHPSLCNDNLSGVALATCLAKALTSSSHRYSYRFLFIPGTIGSIVLAEPQRATTAPDQSTVWSWRVLEIAGIPRTRRAAMGIAEIDRAVVHVLQHSDRDTRSGTFLQTAMMSASTVLGHQSTGGCFSRTPHGQFPGISHVGR